MYDDDNQNMRMKILSLVSGLMFGCAWWLYIDGQASAEDDGYTSKRAGYSWLPGVGMTVAFVSLNLMDWGMLNADPMLYNGTNVALKARAMLVITMVVAMGSLAGAVFLAVNDYFQKQSAPSDWPTNTIYHKPSLYAGVSIMVQNLLIFASSFVMRVGTMSDENDMM